MPRQLRSWRLRPGVTHTPGCSGPTRSRPSSNGRTRSSGSSGASTATRSSWRSATTRSWPFATRRRPIRGRRARRSIRSLRAARGPWARSGDCPPVGAPARFPSEPIAAEVLVGNRKGEVFYERRGFVPRERIDTELFGESVAERRWWLAPRRPRAERAAGFGGRSLLPAEEAHREADGDGPQASRTASGPATSVAPVATPESSAARKRSASASTGASGSRPAKASREVVDRQHDAAEHQEGDEQPVRDGERRLRAKGARKEQPEASEGQRPQQDRHHDERPATTRFADRQPKTTEPRRR